jgi:precorrin-6B C5,15-methyltransferase / cobalt-precorrin-6B C5,C15-methyltransferase
MLSKTGSTPVQVVGIGLEGTAGLAESVRQIIAQATVLVGSDRHLSYFSEHPAEQWLLGDLTATLQRLQEYLDSEPKDARIVILTSGDPLFYGLGRLLLSTLSADQLTFHPHVSSIQLAFNRLKLPWQDAQVISVHGRSLDELTHALQQGQQKIAVLTDGIHTPGAIGQLLNSLALSVIYEGWVCENLGGPEEQIYYFAPDTLDILTQQTFHPLNIVVLQRTEFAQRTLKLSELPILGVSDSSFASFSDQPGLITKREVRTLVLGELALRPGQQVWDIGSGTGSIAIEIARLVPTAQVYAIEKNAAGFKLIQQNADRFQVQNVMPRSGKAPICLHDLPAPDRVFIGGSSGQLSEILQVVPRRLNPGGVIVIAIATLEHLSVVTQWLQHYLSADPDWQYRFLQVQLSRSISVGPLTRLTPLNPVTLVTVTHKGGGSEGDISIEDEN